MAWLRNYLELRSGATTYRFRMAAQDSNMVGRLALATHQRNLDGQLVSVRATAMRAVIGFLTFTGSEAAPYGTLDQLYSLWADTALECRGMADADFWAATIIGDWEPRPLGQMHNYYLVPVRVEQRQ